MAFVRRIEEMSERADGSPRRLLHAIASYHSASMSPMSRALERIQAGMQDKQTI